MNSKVIKFAASGIVLGATMVGCKPAAHSFRPVSLSAKAQKTDEQAAKYYQQAQVELGKGNLPGALALMEQAVEFSPRDAGYRLGLAELYMKSGRFISAETALGDVLALNPQNGRAGISLALAQFAQGKYLSGMTQLQSIEGSVPASDLGLAYALGGNTQRAIELLEPAARELGANGRVRQNLALAYALAGDWKKARITASQDVSPTQLNERMTQWAALADPSAVGLRVANILGVTPAQDAGQPVRLALVPAVAPTEAYVEVQQSVAAEAPAPAYAAAEAVPPPVSAGSEIPFTAAVAEVPAPVSAETAPDPVVEARYAEAAQSLVESPAVQPAAADSRLESIRSYVASRYDTPELGVQARKPARGKYVVQLGAYSTPANVERAWAQATRRYGAVLSNEPLSTTVKLDGRKTLHRLSMAGFTSQSSAARACSSIRAKGGACFVRGLAGDAPVRWASRYSRKA